MSTAPKREFVENMTELDVTRLGRQHKGTRSARWLTLRRGVQIRYAIDTDQGTLSLTLRQHGCVLNAKIVHSHQGITARCPNCGEGSRYLYSRQGGLDWWCRACNDDASGTLRTKASRLHEGATKARRMLRAGDHQGLLLEMGKGPRRRFQVRQALELEGVQPTRMTTLTPLVSRRRKRGEYDDKD